MQSKAHWEKVYTTKAPDNVSWFQAHAETSVRMIHDTGLGREASIIDVGGGASTLVDDLLDDGYRAITVLDLSGAALDESKRRLGTKGKHVHWMETDITRAVFHFLTTDEDRRAYVKQVLHALKPGGHVIMATFGTHGPAQCSGLPVVRYAPEELHSEFGEAFTLLTHEEELHHTPFGTDQQFIYCMCRKTAT